MCGGPGAVISEIFKLRAPNIETGGGGARLYFTGATKHAPRPGGPSLGDAWRHNTNTRWGAGRKEIKYETTVGPTARTHIGKRR